jgi:HK97 family phage major capsid protein
MVTITNLNLQKTKLLADATELVNRGLNTPESKAQHRKYLADIDGVQEHIDLLARCERGLRDVPAPVAAPAPIASVQHVSADEKRTHVNAAYRHLLTHGYHPEAPEQRDILTSGGDPLIPQEFSQAYTSALKFYGPIATLVNQDNDSTGRPRKLTISDDTAATMKYLPLDGSSTGVEADPTLHSTIVGTDSLTTVVKFSLQLLEDSFSLESFIRDIAGLRVARSVEYALTLGKDNYANTALPNSPTGGLLGNVPTGATTASLAGGIGYSDLVNLMSSLDHAYYVNGAFMASPSVFQTLVGQKDSTGRPYYKFDPATGLLQIAGKPLYVNNAMPAYGTASSPVVLFGDFSRAYAYQNGGGMRIRVLSERYIDTFEGAAVIYHRLGAATLVSGAVKCLMTAGS